MALSDILNSPYVAAAQQTAVSALNRNALGSVNNILSTGMSAVSAVETITGLMSSSGLSTGTVGNFVATQTTKYVSGASPFFNSDSPERITYNALAARNKTADKWANPETKMSDTKRENTGSNDLSFPETQAKHFMKFEFHKYRRMGPLGSTLIDKGEIIYLPLPDNIQDSSALQWQSKNLGLAGASIDAIRNREKVTFGGKEVEDTVIRAGQAMFQNAGSELGAALGGVAGPMGSIIGGLVGSAIGSENAADVVSANFGVSQNPVLAQLFDGLQFRTHSFGWSFSPKNEKESAALKTIINRFRVHSLPTFTSSLGFYFNYPDIVLPSFSPTIAANLMPLKYCIIRNITVNFNGAGTPAFYKGTNQPVFIQLSIDLEEMEYVGRYDYTEHSGENNLDELKKVNIGSDILGAFGGNLTGNISDLLLKAGT